MRLGKHYTKQIENECFRLHFSSVVVSSNIGFMIVPSSVPCTVRICFHKLHFFIIVVGHKLQDHLFTPRIGFDRGPFSRRDSKATLASANSVLLNMCVATLSALTPCTSRICLLRFGFLSVVYEHVRHDHICTLADCGAELLGCGRSLESISCTSREMDVGDVWGSVSFLA